MIKTKITLLEKGLEDYLSKGIEIKIKICDKNGKIINKTNLFKINNKDDIMNNQEDMSNTKENSNNKKEY